MSDILPFPNQAASYERMGRKELETGAYLEAVAHLEKAYELEANWERNRLLVSAYIEVAQPEEALILANEYITDYLQEEEGFAQYISVLVHNRKLMKAHILVRNARLSKALEKELTEQLASLDQTLLTINKTEIQATQTWLKKQATSSLYSHLFYQKLESLPIAAFAETSQYLISQATTLPIYRRYILEQAVRLKLTADWSIYLYDGTRQTFSLPSLVPFPEQQHVQMLQACLYELIGDDYQYHDLQEILRLYLSTIYPKAWPEYLNMEVWLICFLSTYLPEMSERKAKLDVDLKPYETHINEIKKVLEQNEHLDK